MIYFAQAGAGGPVKIGWSRTVEARMNTIQPLQPYKLEIIRLLDGPPWVERWLHQQFSSVRLTGEWFTFQPEMLTIVSPLEKPVLRKPDQSVRKEELRTERITTMMTPSQVKMIDDWSFENRIRSQSEAVRRLIKMNLEPAKRSGGKTTSSDQG